RSGDAPGRRTPEGSATRQSSRQDRVGGPRGDATAAGGANRTATVSEARSAPVDRLTDGHRPRSGGPGPGRRRGRGPSTAGALLRTIVVARRPGAQAAEVDRGDAGAWSTAGQHRATTCL